MIDYFDEKQSSDEENLPSWVSTSTKSIIAFRAIEKLIEDKINYINRHRRKKDFIAKKHYTINVREIARQSALPYTTVGSSTYIDDLNKYLIKVVNKDLIVKKNDRIKFIESLPKSRGKYDSSKDELINEAQCTEKKIANLEKNNAEEQIAVVIKLLSPEIKKMLFNL
jgi:tRNA uridine 5-carbamoylmethylation protein Kti12